MTKGNPTFQPEDHLSEKALFDPGNQQYRDWQRWVSRSIKDGLQMFEEAVWQFVRSQGVDPVRNVEHRARGRVVVPLCDPIEGNQRTFVWDERAVLHLWKGRDGRWEIRESDEQRQQQGRN